MPPYNLWYDRPGLNNLSLCNDIVKEDWSHLIKYKCDLPGALRKAKLPFNINKKSSPSDKIFYPIELGYRSSKRINIDDIENFYSMFKNSNGQILIYYPQEGYLFENEFTPFFECLHSRYRKMPIRFVYGNLNQPTEVPNYIDYIGFDFFQFAKRGDAPVLDFNKSSLKDFIFLNGRFKIPRALTYFDLLQNKKLQNAKTSFHGYTANVNIDYKVELEEFIIRSPDVDKHFIYSIDHTQFFKWTNHLRPRKNHMQISHRLAWATPNELKLLYGDSFLNLTVETYFNSDKNNLITEKTYNAIAYGMIFLMCGQQHTLKYLKEKGYQTFDDLFDESYDDKEHWSERWSIIKSNLDIWLSMSNDNKKEYYQKSFNKLIHNQKLYYSESLLKDIDKIFK